MFYKKNFKQGDTVVVNMGMPGMTGMQGTITGLSFVNIFDIYIVDFGKPISDIYQFQSAAIPEQYLNRAE